MLSHSIDQYAETPRARLLWVVIAAVVVAQLVALYMLCDQQVGKAQVRETEVKVQRMAIADCLQYVPASTIGSCAKQARATSLRGAQRPETVVTQGTDASAGGRTAMAGAVPVNFTFR